MTQALGSLLEGRLYNMSSTDPLSAIVAAGVIVAATTLASLVPSRRAIRVSPVDVIRAE